MDVLNGCIECLYLLQYFPANQLQRIISISFSGDRYLSGQRVKLLADLLTDLLTDLRLMMYYKKYYTSPENRSTNNGMSLTEQCVTKRGRLLRCIRALKKGASALKVC
jgi:hypothetical protein